MVSLGVMALLFVLVGCDEESTSQREANGFESQEEPADGRPREISRSDYGEAWPFKVDSGVLACEDDAVTFTAEGTTYAANGLASTWDRGIEIEPIWKKNPEIPGTRINIGPIIDDGLSMCEE